MSVDYWNNRYKKGRGSGAGSVGEFRNFIQHIVTSLDIPFDKTILDYGCGNKSMWSGMKISNYTGLDVSEVINNINKKKYPHLKFILPHELREKYDVSFCISVIIHSRTLDELELILTNLAWHTNETIIISHWLYKIEGIMSHERFWDIKDWKYMIERHGWKLVDQIEYDDKLNVVSIFRRK